jgi:hypothetical protein
MSVRFTVTFVPMRGIDGVRALRWLLKVARRRFGLVAVDAHEERGACLDQAKGDDHAEDPDRSAPPRQTF